MKKLSLLMAVIMLLSCLVVPAVAEEPAAINIIPADGVQAELGYTDGTTILEVDGLKFKDLNKNGQLDVYEDWREDIDARIADLLAQMSNVDKANMMVHANMPTTLGASEADGLETIWYYITVYGSTHFLDNDSKGDPGQMAELHNATQMIGESMPLGIPITITSDRQYNAWSGYLDVSHDAFGTSTNIELAKELWSLTAAEVEATGVHVVLQPYSLEIGAWNGEDPAYLHDFIYEQVQSIQAEGVYTCCKHYITRGGDASFSQAQSSAANLENFIYPWIAAIEADTKWIMTNGQGMSDVTVDFCRESMSYLRDTLGFEGVVVTDWGQVNIGKKGITDDGFDLSTLTYGESFAWIINNGVDQVGINLLTLDESKNAGNCYYITPFHEMVETGVISAERADEACGRLLRTKFELGLFENPYTDPAEALALAASPAYIAERWAITNIDELTSARTARITELERQLQASSTVLVKNDGVLPLNQGTKVYIDSTNGVALADYRKHIGTYGTAVETMDEADVIVIDCTQMNDAAELMIEDAMATGKPLVIVTNCIDPNAWVMENGDAVLFMNFNRTPDHGRGTEGIVMTTEPIVYAELLFGIREPEGMIVKEIARDAVQEKGQWKDLAGDMGTSMEVRMILEAIMLTSDDHSTPNNYGDPLLQYKFGMRYGAEADLYLRKLIVPTETYEYQVETLPGFIRTFEGRRNVVQKSGEPFTIYAIVFNDGADGVLNVEVLDGDKVIDSKLMAVCGDSWRILKMDIVLEGAGEHVLTIGGITEIITVE
ncbi:MAG: hypothetical protein IJE07_00345 [Clostridia bacterium]|nr:hypothetical protein [Clostridia bacterium]